MAHQRETLKSACLGALLSPLLSTCLSISMSASHIWLVSNFWTVWIRLLGTDTQSMHLSVELGGK